VIIFVSDGSHSRSDQKPPKPVWNSGKMGPVKQIAHLVDNDKENTQNGPIDPSAVIPTISEFIIWECFRSIGHSHT
jgi:hypothetical protein